MHKLDTMLAVSIESAVRLKHPTSEFDAPNAFVKLVWPFEGGAVDLVQTQVMEASQYPAWYYNINGLRVPLT